ncbi:S-formylglutathione hydrolase [Candidatus Endowatersipora endosymbiont of Watersipora subatra]|uniref:S-formylglutathione hydrolase n=1 Tax=Candidatus Endowatersipora endosymbiont of Watersipora subatra TaxID=3077946 RepID=UPI00312C848E
MEKISRNRSFNGEQYVYKHQSIKCNCEMTFAIYIPDTSKRKASPLVWYLSGLTCTHANVMEKGEYRRYASRFGLIVVAPDTSPRGKNIPDEVDNSQLGLGAGFYLDATEEPWLRNYQMYSYLTEELPSLIKEEFPVDMSRQSIMGHSMGGHGALIIALRNPNHYKSVSAFSPVVAPMKSDCYVRTLKHYLGEDRQKWKNYDATTLVKSGATCPEILIDQGSADEFLDSKLKPFQFEEACKVKNIKLTLRIQEGYDHSYFFVSTFMKDHIKWHGKRLNA